MKQFTILDQFRHDVYPCFQKAQDALFETCDALLTEPAARTSAELSLSPRFIRQWPSLYAALKDGCIDRAALQRVFAQYAPTPSAGQRLLLGADGTGIARPESPPRRIAPICTFTICPRLRPPWPLAGAFPRWSCCPKRPAVGPMCWTTSAFPVKRRRRRWRPRNWVRSYRICPCGLCWWPIVTMAVPSLSVRRRPWPAISCCGRPAIACSTVRPRRKRRRGTPKKDGHPFKCKNARTWGKPSATWQGADEHDHTVEVTAWSGLHYKQCRAVSLTVPHVVRHGASGKKRDPRVSWFVWIGQGLIALDQVWKTYRRRYGHDHGFRYDKQDLLWLEPHVRTPEQFQRWTDVVAVGRNQLVLARPAGEAQRQPWDSQTRPATPRQVRRSMGRILATLETPAQRPQPRGKSPGRRAGAKIKPAPRYKVVYKGKKRKPRNRKRA